MSKHWLRLALLGVALTIVGLALIPQEVESDYETYETTTWRSLYKEAHNQVPGSDFVHWQQRIIFYALEYGNDPYLALCIATNENRQLDPMAKNPSSSAGGINQIIDSTWLGAVEKMGLDWSLEDKYDGEKNIVVGAWLLKNGGPTQWEVYNQGKCF